MKTAKTVLILCAGFLYLLKNALHYSPLYINILNDLLAIPVFLVVMEFLMQKIYGIAFQMTWKYILATVVTVSVLSELAFPLISQKAIADPVDVLLYFTGGLLYTLFTIKVTKAISDTQEIS